MRLFSVHRLFVVAMLLVVAGSAAYWWSGRDRLPRELRLATGEPGGLYHSFAAALGEELAARTGCRVELVGTHGSVENIDLLRRGGADLAFLQATAVSPKNLSVLAPLYPEVVHVLAREGSGIESVGDLAGRRVCVGPPGSGMRESARALLTHYRIGLEDLEDNGAYFLELEGGAHDAAIVTTGVDNPDLGHLLETGDFELVPILDGAAITLRQPLFTPFRIPRGLYHEGPPVPPVPLSTVATSAVLVAQPDAGDELVRVVMEALYADHMRASFPMMTPEADALAIAPAPLHPRARAFLDPYGGVDALSRTIETLSGTKELLFGLGALCYIVWDSVRSMRRRRRQREVDAERQRLDGYLARTVAIERAQMDTTDVEELENFLDQVTELKLEALEQLTHEDLRGDRMFLIFLTQCANLIRKIQTKILTARALQGSDAGGGALAAARLSTSGE